MAVSRRVFLDAPCDWCAEAGRDVAAVQALARGAGGSASASRSSTAVRRGLRPRGGRPSRPAPAVLRSSKGAVHPSASALRRVGGLDVLHDPGSDQPDILFGFRPDTPRCAWRSPTCSAFAASPPRSSLSNCVSSASPESTFHSVTPASPRASQTAASATKSLQPLGTARKQPARSTPC